MNRFFQRLSLGAFVALTLSTPTLAQWSIGQPGTREAPKGQNRYVYLVMADPLPGREFDFNDGYQNTHMGDLVQLPGWTGAQRFRLVPVTPRTTQPQVPPWQPDYLGSGGRRSWKNPERVARRHRRRQKPAHSRIRLFAGRPGQHDLSGDRPARDPPRRQEAIHSRFLR